MKKVAIILPNLERGGAQTAAAKLSRMLSTYYDVKVVLFQNSTIEQEFGGELVVIDEPKRRKWYSAALLYRRVKKIRKWKREEKIDVAISFMEGASLVNILSNRGEKVIVSVRSRHDQENHGTKERLRLGLIYRLYHFTDKVVVVSKLLKGELIESYGLREDQIEVIYNHYSKETIGALAKEEIEENLQEVFHGAVVITAGRLVPAKGQWHLIRAFRTVVDSRPDAKLVILGSGEMEDQFLRLIRDLTLDKNVLLLGHKDNPFKYIAKSTMFVLPSLYEGFPNALCEAMACGVPVIATDCKSGPREILSPASDYRIQTRNIELAEYGVLAPPLGRGPCSASEPLSSGERALAGSIEKLLSDEKTRQHYILKSGQRLSDFGEDKASEKWKSIV